LCGRSSSVGRANGRAAAYVAGFAARSEHRRDPAVAEPSVRDPDDDYLVALAREERVDSLVSLDRDLLEADLEDLLVSATSVARLA
jgi:predicted nucleic acid-binding protein